MSEENANTFVCAVVTGEGKQIVQRNLPAVEQFLSPAQSVGGALYRLGQPFPFNFNIAIVQAVVGVYRAATGHFLNLVAS